MADNMFLLPHMPNTSKVPSCLVLALGQKQTQLQMARVLASMHMCPCRGDLYHRSLTECGWAVRWVGGFLHYSTMQMRHAETQMRGDANNGRFRGSRSIAAASIALRARPPLEALAAPRCHLARAATVSEPTVCEANLT